MRSTTTRLDPAESTEKQGEDLTAEITQTDEIDWPALFEEFGFDSEDAIGSILISHTQLVGAIGVSEQDIDGTPESNIETALSDGVLRYIEKNGGHRGYQLAVMLA